jgi:hypothetical protein
MAKKAIAPALTQRQWCRTGMYFIGAGCVASVGERSGGAAAAEGVDIAFTYPG